MSNQDNPLSPGFVERRRHPRVAKEALGVEEGKEGTLIPLRFETSSLPAFRQFPTWREHMAALMDCRLPDHADPESGFLAEQAIWNLGGVLLLQQTTPAFSFVRSPEMVRLSPIDHWYITFLRTGCSWVEADGHVAENKPGMMSIRSLGRPFRGRKQATTTVSLIMPADLFANHGGLPAACNNVILGGHRVKLLVDYISSVETNLTHFTEGDLPTAKDRMRDMVFDAVTPLVDRDQGHDHISQIGLMTRARRFILGNISSPDLTIEGICKELAISRTRLYELFEASGGVANYIRRRRLLAAHAMLADPADNRKVAEIGLTIGFDSAANFSRAFTQHFGYSPSNIFKRNAPGDQALHGMKDNMKSDVTFDGLLRTLALV
jgi:AraC-like DNA-binding protein